MNEAKDNGQRQMTAGLKRNAQPTTKDSQAPGKTGVVKNTTALSRDKAVELAAEGKISQTEAGAMCGYSQQRISQLIRDYKSNTDTILFSNDKDKVFESLQAKIVNAVSDEDIKKASLSQKIVATAVIQDKIQVMRGQATDIIDYRSLSLSGTLRELREARARAIDQQKVINNEANEQVVDITNDIA